MRVLLTGGSSVLGARVLRCLLADEAYAEVWCGVHRRDVAVAHAKLRKLPLSLAGGFDLSAIPAPLDLVVHFAALTHAQDERAYWAVNFRGTTGLADEARARGCRRFFYVSTRCAAPGSGAYGESKRAAELELLKLSWDGLLILRPSEVYGGGGREGVDKLVRLAARLHVAPLLWGHRGIRFAPLHVDDFAKRTCALLLAGDLSGVKILNLCGPESLSGVTLALRLARRYAALPLPVWWPALRLALLLTRRAGWSAAPDQAARLIGPKTAECSTADPLWQTPMIRFPERADG